MKFNYKVILSALSVAFIATLGCDDAAKKADQAQQISLLALAAGSSATGTCMNCHVGSGDLGNAFLDAKEGWENSVHKNGMKEEVRAQYGGATWYTAGYEWAGSDDSYANAGGCQLCHTHEGFLKRIDGTYGTIFANGNMNNGQIAAMINDVIDNPSPPGCFTCHDPHSKLNFDRRIADGTTVNTANGGQWTKAAGSICVACHQVRMFGSATDKSAAPTYYGTCSANFDQATPITATPTNRDYYWDCDTAEDMIIQTARVAGYRNSGWSSWGPHHGPQSDMILGKGGAQYGASLTSAGTAFAGSYSNSGHTTAANAFCPQCHMTLPNNGRASMSPEIGGHSFAIGGITHGGQSVNPFGCQLSSCHLFGTSSEVCASSAGSTSTSKCRADGTITAGAVGGTAIRAMGFMPTGSAVIRKGTGVDENQYINKINWMLRALADPDNGCAGLLNTYAIANGIGTITWSTEPDGATNNKKCLISSTATTVSPNAAAAADTPVVKFAKALWNYKFVYAEDKSFGAHNTSYAAQLLFDSCKDLNTPQGTDCNYNSVGIIPVAPRPTAITRP